jgi:hypothetical protein
MTRVMTNIIVKSLKELFEKLPPSLDYVHVTSFLLVFENNAYNIT